MKKAILTIAIIVLAASLAYSQRRIEMEKQGGVYYVPCTVNGLKMRFIFDTGAANVVISLSEALFMLKNGYLAEEDIHGASYSQLANGEIIENTTITLRTLDIGGILLRDIEAVVIHEPTAPLLLGQSAIRRLGRVEIDGEYLVIKEFPSNEPAYSLQDASTMIIEGIGNISNGQYYLALENFEAAYRINPNAFKFSDKYFFGASYFNVGNYDKAINVLEWGAKSIHELEARQIIEDSFFIRNIYIDLGLSYNKVENYDKALLNFEKALQNAEVEDFPFIYNGISFAYSGLRNYYKALENSKFAIKYLLQELGITELDIVSGKIFNEFLGELYYHLSIDYNSLSDRQNAEKQLILSALCGYRNAINDCRHNGINYESYRFSGD